jgi:hypothetical protein
MVSRSGLLEAKPDRMLYELRNAPELDGRALLDSMR